MPHIFRKQTSLLALFLGLAIMTVAQDVTPVSTADNSIRPFSGGNQFRKFSIGLNVGALSPSIIFGGSNDFTNPQFDLGYGANLRYQFNHWLAIQADYLGGKLKGNQDDELGNGQPVTGRPVTSFTTDLKYAGSVSGQLTIGNINWLRARSSFVPYVSVGAGIAGYTPKVIKAGSTTEVEYSPETINEFFVPVGVGAKINLSSLLNLDLGYRMHFLDGDNLDGSPYWEYSGPNRPASNKKDKFSYGFIGLEFALGNQSKPQMLFDNPAARMNAAIQTQIDTIKQDIVGIKSDTDGDGVADMFDKEPNTPAGSPVDSHGVTRDTDNDGVPDWKDKQMITPSECQPVDADGVGKCPEPACCATLDSLMRSGTFSNNNCPTDYPSLSLKGTTLSADVKAMLSSVATKLKDSPNCTITITAYPGASKNQQSLADRKLTAVKNYLVETLGVSEDRITTDKMIGGGDANVIDIK